MKKRLRPPVPVIRSNDMVSLTDLQDTAVPDWECILHDAVADEWRGLDSAWRPWGVWVRRYPMLPVGQRETDAAAMPEAVWFLDRDGLKRRSVWEWRRFFVVQFEQPWSWYKEAVTVFREPPQIGMAAFAPLPGGRYYLETQWTGKYGVGWELTLREDGLISRAGLWIS